MLTTVRLSCIVLARLSPSLALSGAKSIQSIRFHLRWEKCIYLHVLSSPSSETGPPHAILRSLQKKQAICCFFWRSFFCGARFTPVGNGCLCFSRGEEFFGNPGDAERELPCWDSVGRNGVASLSFSRPFRNATFADSSEYEERWWGGTVSCWGEQERDMGR